MSFTEILNWDLSSLTMGAEALAKRADTLQEYADRLGSAAGLEASAWSGAAADQARSLAAVHGGHSSAIAVQARTILGPLTDYATNGAALKAAAVELAQDAAAHGFQIQADGSVQGAGSGGFYAAVVKQKLDERVAQLIAQDGQLHQNLADSIRAAPSPEQPKTAAVSAAGLLSAATGGISLSAVDYSGKGSWSSGSAACKTYIDQALDAMGVTNATARANWEKGMLTIASRESASNASAWQVNTSDSNATGAKVADGYPAGCSRGMCQTIPSTFAAYHQAGTSDKIYDPVANAAAAMNYIKAKYGVAADGHDLAAKVQQADPSRSPKGY